MGLNSSKGNMYDFVTHTWNVIKGACSHDCSYCYMKRWGKLNPVRFDEKEMNSDLGEGNFIFVGSSTDMFADNIPRNWIVRILEKCSKSNNRYLFQTKNPKAFHVYKEYLPVNSIIGTTIETDRRHEHMGNTKHPILRLEDLGSISGFDKFVTIEPIMYFDDPMLFADEIRHVNPKHVNIGADSGGNKLPEPTSENILLLIDYLNEFTEVRRKKNLNRLLK